MENPRRHQSGFTLIEMLIALGLGMIVISAAIGVFNYSQSSYNIQEDVAAMQQDLRIAKSFIERDVRMAGAGFADYPRLSDIAAENFLVLDFENNGGAGESDTLTVRYFVPIPDPCGTPPSGEVSCSALPELTLKNLLSDGSETTDPIDVDSTTLFVNEDLASTAPNFNLWNGSCYCRGGEQNGTSGTPIIGVIIHPDADRADRIAITSVDSGAGSFTNTPLNGSSTNSYPAGSKIKFFDSGPISEIHYFLQDGILMRTFDPNISTGGGETTDPVAEHIEDLQFAFGLDNDDDNVVDEWIDGSDDTDLNADDLTDANKAMVRAIRISVLGRTDRARKELEANGRPAVEDHLAADGTDYFRRRLSQVTVEVRNMTLESPEDATGGGGGEDTEDDDADDDSAEGDDTEE
ncbi:PilW family protein [Desulfococcus sp.]|uniref:PilW family protein n=1 Tax=Desulfococcus sp. TaxID=2025834 RepID=UPI00359473A2